MRKKGPLSGKSPSKRGPRPPSKPRKVHRHVPGTVLMLYANRPASVLIYLGGDDYIWEDGTVMVKADLWSSYVDNYLDELWGWRAVVHE